MSKYRRVALFAYLMAIVYVCTWIPWQVQRPGSYGTRHLENLGYGFLWSGPEASPWPGAATRATPDLTRIGLRLAALTALAGAAWLLVPKRAH